MIGKCDDKGRLYIPKKLQSKIKGNVYLVELKEGLLVVPIPEDPVSQLRSIGKELPDKSISELKDIIKQEALKDISEEEK
ncbi:MAG: AbrB family transcriptional regulator [Promethearchaeia archaeon]